MCAVEGTYQNGMRAERWHTRATFVNLSVHVTPMKTVREPSAAVIQEIQKIERTPHIHSILTATLSFLPVLQDLVSIVFSRRLKAVAEKITFSFLPFLPNIFLEPLFHVPPPGFPVFTNNAALSRGHSYH